MQFLQTVMSVIINFCLPFRGSPLPVGENPYLEPQLQRDEPGEDLIDLYQKLVRMDVEFTMFKANDRMYEHEHSFKNNDDRGLKGRVYLCLGDPAKALELFYLDVPEVQLNPSAS